jgi:hypothetical protein
MVQLQGDDYSIYTNATDISMGGAFLNTLYILQEGSLLSLSFQAPKSEKILSLKGKVVRQASSTPNIPTMDKIGMAIEFIDVDHEAKTWLEDIATSN